MSVVCKAPWTTHRQSSRQIGPTHAQQENHLPKATISAAIDFISLKDKPSGPAAESEQLARATIVSDDVLFC